MLTGPKNVFFKSHKVICYGRTEGPIIHVENIISMIEKSTIPS